MGKIEHMRGKKIRIVFGLNDFLVGGMQKQFSEQIRHFDREKFDIILITLFQFPNKENLYGSLPKNLPIHRLDFTGWWSVGQWYRLYRLLLGLHPDIVVSSLFFANTVFRVFKPLVGYMSIAREHNTYIDKSLLQRITDRLLAHFSYKIVAVSTTVANFTSAQEHIPQSKFIVIHNGIDVQKICAELEKLAPKEDMKKELGLSPTDKVFVNVARLTGQKNHKLLIDGFIRFSTKHPNCKLAIVGGGDLQQELEQYAKESGAGGTIVFFGHQSDTFRFYKVADAFVSTSDIEGLSNSYLKALASGLPLLSTKTAGTDELIRDGQNGLFIPDASADTFVKIMEKFLNLNQELLRKNALETAGRFSIQHTVSQYQNLFTEAYKHIRHRDDSI